MSTREAFEKVYSRVMGTPVTVLQNMRTVAGYKETEGERLSIAWEIWQAATEQGVVPVSNPDLCPICKDRQVIPDEDWCGPCREEFYDTVMESGDTDSPAEQGMGEAVAWYDPEQKWNLSNGGVISVCGQKTPMFSAPLYTHPPKPTGGGVPECPYPCGWRELHSIITKKAAYFASATLGDEPWSDQAREYGIDLGIYARDLCSLLATQQPPEQE